MLLQDVSAFLCQPLAPGVANSLTTLYAKSPLGSSDLKEKAQLQLADATVGSNGNKSLQVAVLAAVPVLWGTYTPSVKFMSALDAAVQPPGLIFNAACYVISGAALWASIAVAAASKKLTGE